MTPLDTLPAISETKLTLNGRRKIYACRRLPSATADLVVLFISDAGMRVADVQLDPGTITFGYFWRDRPFNVYHWLSPQGATLGHYFNLADQTQIGDGELRWRDLIVDVLLRPDGRAEVLDRDELPATLDPAINATIEAGTAHILAHADNLRAVLEASATDLWRVLFEHPRGEHLP